jgi:cytochrome c oxidase cbb3-type subunit 3
MSDARAHDSALPRWWLWATAFTVALAAGYWLWIEPLHLSPTPFERYVTERAAALDTGEPVTEKVIADLARDKLAVRAGEGAFARNCAKCHGARAEGHIGPNLTDDFWIGGGAALDIYQTILRGRDGKGMPSWGLLLGTGDCKQLAAYVVTLRGTNRPGKAPQGAKWVPTAP